MKIMDLKPGVYRLTRDVTNPKPDRRHAIRERNWMVNPEVSAGMRFIVREGGWFRGTNLTEAQIAKRVADLGVPGPYELSAFDSSYGGGVPLWRATEAGNGDKEDAHVRAYLAAIIDALEPAPVTPSVFFSDHGLDLHNNADDVLISMLRHGIIGWDTLEEGFNALATDREEYERRNEGKPYKEHVDLPLPVYEAKS